MNTIKIAFWVDVPQCYTGIVEFENGTKIWLKYGKFHREDGPAYIENNGYKQWWLDGVCICNLNHKLDLRDKIILSKTQHPLYPTVQIWKILNNKIYELTVIPGMEEFITE